jgi:hypothetical protein
MICVGQDCSTLYHGECGAITLRRVIVLQDRDGHLCWARLRQSTGRLRKALRGGGRLSLEREPGEFYCTGRKASRGGGRRQIVVGTGSDTGGADAKHETRHGFDRSNIIIAPRPLEPITSHRPDRAWSTVRFRESWGLSIMIRVSVTVGRPGLPG